MEVEKMGAENRMVNHVQDEKGNVRWILMKPAELNMKAYRETTVRTVSDSPEAGDGKADIWLETAVWAGWSGQDRYE